MPLVLLFGDAPEFGSAAAWVVSGGAYLLLGVLGVLVFALGRAWFGWAAGALAALIILTREPVLSYGLRAYVDLPYLCLLLGALLVETKRPRAGWPVLALLALAGLLRPEAWLFSGAYVLWLAWGPDGLRGRALVQLCAIAASAPLLWALHDLLLTGNPLWSLTGTRDNAAELGRKTGLLNVPTTLPRRLGEILREPVLLAAAGGLGFGIWKLRDQARLGVIAGLLGLAAFTVLATAGLSILVRYLLPVATIGAIFAGAGVFGWMLLDRDDRARRWWIGFAAVVVLALVAFTPKQFDRLDSLQRALSTQEAIVGDLETFFSEDPPGEVCPVYVVPNRRPVPYVALWTGGQPGDTALADERPPPPESTDPATAVVAATQETVFLPRTRAIADDFILDARDRDRALPTAPPGGRTTTTAFWTATSFACRGS
ncbi:hypothetical protein LRS13_09675 [Svornostia abyssi]|uniref:Glycosyltransferase RgtA/B/C/D-like domain-containing protein n=1 Tax=Svornostia abyssi TaxID=2898438 RepID=A0ABY5PN70_9ACTN|nr:hypothetical protein LRS13_09675 [Parviterribacteraceae bacterium J379]